MMTQAPRKRSFRRRTEATTNHHRYREKSSNAGAGIRNLEEVLREEVVPP
jgi:hypothetical protein